MVSKVRDNIQEINEKSGFFEPKGRECDDLTAGFVLFRRHFSFCATIFPSVPASDFQACLRHTHSNKHPDFMSECQNGPGFSSRHIDHIVRISSI